MQRPSESPARPGLWWALPALALASLGCAPPAMPASVAHPLAGRQAPELDGASATSSGSYGPGGAKVTVVDFWASWCPACAVTMPALQRLSRDHAGDGVSVVGVSVDAHPDEAFATTHRLGATFPLVLDTDQHLAGRYAVGRLPLTFVIDRKGTVRWIGRDPGDLRRAVDALLGE